MARQWVSSGGVLVSESGSRQWVKSDGTLAGERALWTGSVSESLTAADSVNAAATFASSITESLTAADALVAQCAFASALTETLTASDALASVAIYNVPLTETLTAADSLTAQAVLSVAISEALTASDSYASVVSGADPNWGGCFVWLSTDGVTYQQVGEVTSSARMGFLTGNLASYGGANPDTIASFGVDLTESGSDLTGVSATDAADYTTLSVIKDAGGSLEFLAYRDAALTSTYHYMLGGQLYRGLYGTAAGAHVVGAQFARLDGNIFKLDLPPQYIGKTLYVKLQSFNVFGLGVQDLSTCTPYTYVVSGTGYGGGTGGVPTTPATPTAAVGAGFVSLSWAANPMTDNVARYDVYRAPGLGASFGSAALIGSNAGTSYTDGTVAAATAYTYFIKAVNAVGSSAASAGASVTSGTQGIGNPTESLEVACSDEATALAAGTAKVTFRMPYAFTLTGVRASLKVAQASGSILTVDIKCNGTTIFSTLLTIDNTEKTSVTAATPAVLSTTGLPDDAEMTVDITQVGTSGAMGLKVVLIGHR